MKVCFELFGLLCFAMVVARFAATIATRISLVMHFEYPHPCFLFFQFRNGFFGIVGSPGSSLFLSFGKFVRHLNKIISAATWSV